MVTCNHRQNTNGIACDDSPENELYPCRSVDRSFSSLLSLDLRQWLSLLEWLISRQEKWQHYSCCCLRRGWTITAPSPDCWRVDRKLPCFPLMDSSVNWRRRREILRCIPLWEFGAERRRMVASKRERREMVSWYHNLQVERGEVIDSSDRSVCALDMAMRHGSFLTWTGIVIGNGWRVD